MALTINHQTNDISATSGSMTIDGSAVGGGGASSNVDTGNFIGGTGAGAGLQSGGDYNTLLGQQAGNDITTGDYNTVVGYNALSKNQTGGYNVAIGHLAGEEYTFSESVFIGRNAGKERSTGNLNIGIGKNSNAGFSSTLATGNENVGVGTNTIARVTYGTYNAAFGGTAGFNVTTGTHNNLFGYLAGYNITTGNNNTCIGNQAGRSATTSNYLTAIGYGSLYSTTGGYNVAYGAESGYDVSTGEYNTIIGHQAANSGTNDLTSGSNNTLIGYQSAASSSSVSNEITLGNSSISSLRCQVQTISSLSDERDKTNIEPLQAGLDFVERLKPVSFTWNMRDGGKVGIEETGFIAQDLQQVQQETGINIPNLVFDENPERLEASYGTLVPALVQAIKDLSLKVNDLEAQVKAQGEK